VARPFAATRAAAEFTRAEDAAHVTWRSVWRTTAARAAAADGLRAAGPVAGGVGWNGVALLGELLAGPRVHGVPATAVAVQLTPPARRRLFLAGCV
jgi:hypothetical protein